jgi:hypothetical protein
MLPAAGLTDIDATYKVELLGKGRTWRTCPLYVRKAAPYNKSRWGSLSSCSQGRCLCAASLVRWSRLLDLTNTKLTDLGVKELKELKQLTRLMLSDTPVTDAGLKDLKELKQLTTLYLGSCKVTDTGLKDLKELKQLTTLGLRGTQVTDAGVKELQEALPECKVRR